MRDGSQMRVVGGVLGGRRLATPAGTSTRPTSELIRASIFNSLAARGLIEGAVVADLFAGSGALGIEALSRGAAHATFVESDRRAGGTILANVTALDLRSAATVAVCRVEDWPLPSPAPDLVLADPPYTWDGWPALLQRLAPTALTLVAEAGRGVEGDGWEVLAVKRHGGTVVSQLRPRGANRT
jgi:16S rRNA (guanine966-N2)-methyltransferase